MLTYGRKMTTFTSIMMLVTMMGFVIAYLVLLKDLLPQVVS
jgi:amino acid permease